MNGEFYMGNVITWYKFCTSVYLRNRFLSAETWHCYSLFCEQWYHVL